MPILPTNETKIIPKNLPSRNFLEFVQRIIDSRSIRRQIEGREGGGWSMEEERTTTEGISAVVEVIRRGLTLGQVRVVGKGGELTW